uniref:Lipocalin/cytosolic fatty-acid binding domain-containing protein n=1 Tax=Syphacia muris TaxID=451379 RepID=A0A0N5AIF5_9BILA
MFGLNTGRAGTVDRIPLDDITRFKKPLPKVTFFDGMPAVPGLVGSLPGVGGCLPKQMPMVNQNSPSFFQNFLRLIPGAQDYLSTLVITPEVDIESLSGKYQWIISTKGVHQRYCPTTEFQYYVKTGNTSAINIVNAFHETNPQGAAKVGFGYGIIHNQKLYLYFQEDPCPYQIVMIGPRNERTGQYEYLVLSNWAKYPLIAMVRDYNDFMQRYRDEFVRRFKKEGFISEFSSVIGDTVDFVDWSLCRPLTPVSFLSNVLNRFLFG